MKIALGCDHAGFKLKESVQEHLLGKDIYVYDFGTFDESPIDYPDIAYTVGKNVLDGKFDFGIIVCGTGVGVSITANKIRGIRAALCGDTFTAHAAREHNDANILTLGSRVTGTGLALDIVDTFISTAFAGGRHLERIKKIQLYEESDGK
ncbi:MAG: ribose 5-phosphate isomerase B [Dethiobacteria bacterium]